MKQMIKNWSQIESLEDFVYYDKTSGKIKVKKELDLAVPISGGTQLYKHTIKVGNVVILIISSESELYSDNYMEVFFAENFISGTVLGAITVPSLEILYSLVLEYSPDDQECYVEWGGLSDTGYVSGNTTLTEIGSITDNVSPL